MKNKLLLTATSVILSVICLTGCSSGSDILNAAKKYGMKEAESAEEAINVWAANENGAICYSSKDSNQIKALTWSLVGTDYENVNEFKMCVEVDTTSDEAGAGHFFNYVYQMTTGDKESAEYIYKTESSKYAFRGESTTDKKGGWDYTVCIEESETSDGIVYDVVHGVYVKGNDVIYMYGINRADNNKTSIAYICKSLGLVSPYSLKK